MTKSGKGSGFSNNEETFNPNPGGGGGGGNGDDWWGIGPAIPSTLEEALGEKGREMSMAAAAAGTNPHYDTSYDAYSSNCQRAVLTYEARRRGYDVTALPTYKGDMLPYSKDYMKALSNPNTVSTGKSVRKIEAQMKSYGNGARAIITVNKSNGNGHAFIAEYHSGKVSYIDPQTNSRYTKLNLSKVASSTVTRVDNQKFTEYAKNAFTRQKV